MFFIMWKDIENNLITHWEIWGLEDTNDSLPYKFGGTKPKIFVDLYSGNILSNNRTSIIQPNNILLNNTTTSNSLLLFYENSILT